MHPLLKDIGIVILGGVGEALAEYVTEQVFIQQGQSVPVLIGPIDAGDLAGIVPFAGGAVYAYRRNNREVLLLSLGGLARAGGEILYKALKAAGWIRQPFNIDYEFPITNLIREPLIIDYDFPSTNVIRQAKASWVWPIAGSQRAPSPYVQTTEFLPFQTDIGY